MFDYIFIDLVELEREGWGSRVVVQFFKFLIVIVARYVKKSSKIFLIFLETLTKSYHHTLGAFVVVIGSGIITIVISKALTTQTIE